MKTDVRLLTMTVVAVFLIWGLAIPGHAANDKPAGWESMILDESSAHALIARAVKSIQDELSAPKKDGKAIRKSYKKIQVAAVMIAAIAQSAKPTIGKAKLVAYRDSALELAKAAAKGDAAEIDKLSKALATPKTNPKNKAAPVSLKEYLEDSGDVMQPLRRFALGGDGIDPALQSTGPLKSLNGIEEKLRVLGRRPMKAPQLAKESAQLVLMAQKIAVVGQMAHEWAPAKEGNLDPKDWREWSVEMRDSALNLAEAAKNKNANAVFTATKTLNANCTKCHGIFKKN
jgi:hypothetical protein